MQAINPQSILDAAQGQARERVLSMSDVHTAYEVIEKVIRAVATCGGVDGGVDALAATVDLDAGAVTKGYGYRAQTTVCVWGVGLDFRARRARARTVRASSDAIKKRLRVSYELPSNWTPSTAPACIWRGQTFKARKDGGRMVFTVYL